MIKNLSQDNKTTWISFFIMCIPVFIIIYWSPLVSDDLGFSSYHFTNIKDSLDYSLHYGNGRLLGNWINIILLENEILRVLVKTLTITGIFILIPKILKLENKDFYLLTFVLMFGISARMFAEIYSWTSGFQNYTPPILLLLLCIYIWQNYNENNVNNILSLILIFIFGVIGQLYVETSTIANFLIALVFMVYSLKIKNNKKLVSFVWFVGTTLGSIIMILIPKIFYLEESAIKMTNYRSIDISISTFIKNSLYISNVFMRNIVLLILLSILLIILLEKFKHNWKRKYSPKLLKSFLITFICFEFYYLIFCEPWPYSTANNNIIVITLIFFLLFILSTIEIILHLDNNKSKYKIMLCVGASIFFGCPALIISIRGCRLLFLSYVLLVMSVLLIFKYCLENNWIPYSKYIDKVFIIFSIILSLFVVTEFSKIHKIEKETTVYIEKQIKQGSTEIDVPLYPSNYVFVVEGWSLKKYYSNEKENIQFNVMEFDEWLDKKKD